MQKFRIGDSKVFVGYDKGESDRKSSKIDELISNTSRITLIIPNGIYAVNPSYLIGLLENVVVKLGQENFLKRCTIINDGEYKVKKDLYEAIDRILR